MNINNNSLFSFLYWKIKDDILKSVIKLIAELN